MINIIVLAVITIASAVLATVLALRSIGHDEHYGQLGLGSMTQSATNIFSSAPLPEIIEPDIIIKTGTGKRRVLDIDIDDILVWDVRQWDASSDVIADLVGGEDASQRMEARITHDNNSLVTDGGGPVAATIAEGFNPGGAGAAVAGTLGLGTTVMNGQEVPRYEAYFEFVMLGNEQNAAGVINMRWVRAQKYSYSPYEVDGNTAHKLLTAAHYWLSIQSNGLAATATVHLGANVRRMAIDIEELMFDREVLISILNALVVSN